MKTKSLKKKPGGDTGAPARRAQGAASADLVGLVALRAEFYKDMASHLKKLAIIGVVSMLLSVVALVVAASMRTDYGYIAVDENNAIIPLVALSEPNHSDAAVASWVSRALIDTYDFNYTKGSMERHLNRIFTQYYTDSGRQEFLDGLQKSGNWNAIRDNKLILSLSVDHTPLVVRKGNVTFTNSYLWKLEAQVTITYRTESAVYSDKALITITVARTSNTVSKDGLGIARIVVDTHTLNR